jgi:hypothetical protein
MAEFHGRLIVSSILFLCPYQYTSQPAARQIKPSFFLLFCTFPIGRLCWKITPNKRHFLDRFLKLQFIVMFCRSSELLHHTTWQLTIGVPGWHILPINNSSAVKGLNFSWTPLLLKMKPVYFAETSVAIHERRPRNISNIPEDLRFQLHSDGNLKSSVSRLKLYYHQLDESSLNVQGTNEI